MDWVIDEQRIDWKELSDLYRLAPLGEKSPEDLRLVFSNSMFKCFVIDEGILVGAGRALADGRDCAYLCDIAVHPLRQGLGLGKAIVDKLCALAAGHKKIILYAKPDKEGFYRKLGFRRMCTAMAIFENPEQAVRAGLLERS
ncbi:MAG TPA: GNAT family N-acetyltransferase [Burkholderiales bacterium]|nr:GNAT family N-acetyltransferase [Burkholderiales bacterium]